MNSAPLMTRFRQVALSDNLMRGWMRLAGRRVRPGVDGQSMQDFSLNLRRELASLEQSLVRGTYQAAPLLAVDIDKPTGGKRRLGIATTRDRVAQSSALVVLGPSVEAVMAPCSYAYRPGRSYRTAVERVRTLQGQELNWVVDADIRTFFDSVPHEVALEALHRLAPEPELLALVQQWLAAPMQVRGACEPRTKGLPQGTIIAPMLANLVLDRLDREVLDAGYELVRFSDDFVILADSEAEAVNALRLSNRILRSLGLELHEEKTQITTFERGFKFLGTLFVRSFSLKSKDKTKILPTTPVYTTFLDKQEDFSPCNPESDLEEAVLPTDPPAFEGDGCPFDLGIEIVDPVPAREASSPELVVPSGRDDTKLAAALLEALEAQTLTLQAYKRRFEKVECPVRTAHPEVRLKNPQFLRTLYIQEQGARLSVKQKRLRVTAAQDGPVLLDVAAHRVQQIVVLGTVHLTPGAVRFCLKENISVFYLSRRGTYYGALCGRSHVDTERVRAQYGMESADRLRLARAFVRAKLVNTRRFVARRQRRRPTEAGVQAQRELGRFIRKIEGMKTLESLRGLEGAASAAYFEAFEGFLEEDGWFFSGRNRRPPQDPVNALLSLGYTLLFNQAYAALKLQRLDPYVGMLHAERRGHAALASDLMEAFRFLIDRLVVRVINRRTLQPRDFYKAPAGEEMTGCYLKQPALKTYLEAFEHLMNQQITHPTLSREVTYRQCIEVQAQLLARTVMDGADYTPFLPK